MKRLREMDGETSGVGGEDDLGHSSNDIPQSVNHSDGDGDELTVPSSSPQIVGEFTMLGSSPPAVDDTKLESGAGSPIPTVENAEGSDSQDDVYVTLPDRSASADRKDVSPRSQSQESPPRKKHKFLSPEVEPRGYLSSSTISGSDITMSPLTTTPSPKPSAIQPTTSVPNRDTRASTPPMELAIESTPETAWKEWLGAPFGWWA